MAQPTRDFDSEVRQRARAWLPAELISRLDVSNTFSAESKLFARRQRLSAATWRHIATRIIDRLESLSLVTIAPSRAEVRAGRLTRDLPIRGEFELPSDLVNGSFVRGTDAAGGAIFARVSSRHLGPRGYPLSAIALVMVTLPLLLWHWQFVVALAPLWLALLSRRKLGWLVVDHVLIASLIACGVIAIYYAPYLMRSGLERDLATTVALAIALAVLTALLLLAWHSSNTRAHYGFRDDDNDYLAGRILSWRERLSSSVLRWRHGLAVASLAALMYAFSTGQELAVRAQAATAVDSHLVAHDLFAQLASEATSEDQRAAWKRCSATELLAAIDDYSRRGAWHHVYDLIRRLEPSIAVLGADETARLASKVSEAADALAAPGAEAADWTRSRELYALLMSRFPESEEALDMKVRSDWRLVAAEPIRFERRLLGYKVPIEDRDEMEESLVWHVAAPGHVYVILELEVAHLGEAPKTLINSSLRASIDGRDIAGLGILHEEGMTQAKRFPGTSIGPDLVTVEVAFEVPDASTQLVLRLDGRQRTPVDYAMLDTIPAVPDSVGEQP